jgi:polyketide synthase-associated protein
VIETFLDENAKRAAISMAKKQTDFYPFPAEVEDDYMGKRNCTKAIQLGKDTVDAEPSTDGDILAWCDRQLTILGMSIAPHTDDYLGFSAFGRYNGMVRLPYANKAEAAQLAPLPIDESDVTDGKIGKYMSFVQSRKVCMLHMIDNEGGDVKLHFKDGDEVTVTVAPNRLLLFRHDMMNYTYKPNGFSVALQSWMLAPMPSYQLDKLDSRGFALDKVYNAEGPNGGWEGRRCGIMALQCRFPGEVCTSEQYFSMVGVGGTDAYLQWPASRFGDIDLYYTSDPNAALMSKSYTCHGGFNTDEQLFSFAHDFFGITADQAWSMHPCHYEVLEVGYDCLHMAGFTKNTLRGKHMGCYMGDIGDDSHQHDSWLSLERWDPELSAVHVHSAMSATRIGFTFGLQGPTMTFDTACSAGLVSIHFAHMNLLSAHDRKMPTDGALAGGINVAGVIGFVGACGASMLSHLGRCFTYDKTADGFERGEGCGMMYLNLSDKYEDVMGRLGVLAGSSANQDGKSASLTSPNGPSQQACIRQSLTLALRDPADITFVECHGTGTALGDPIEMGAILNVMDGERDNPLPHTSAKSNMGHLEACAGTAGLCKCLVMLMNGVSAPNVHLYQLNPHLEQLGFPQLFETEAVDTGVNSGMCGVSSFGFGGTNARGDLYARARLGPRARLKVDTKRLDFLTVPCPKCFGNMCWRCGVAVPTRAKTGSHYCSLIREEPDYEYCSNCYKGEYRHGEPVEDIDTWEEGVQVGIVGSWDGHADVHDMVQVDDRTYECYVAIGQSLQERFHLVVDGRRDEIFYPAQNGSASSVPGSVRIVGPDAEGKQKHWLVDGRSEKVLAGSVFKITFEWGERLRTIQWAKTDEAPDDMILGSGARHTCFIVGSWNDGKVQQMTPLVGEEEAYAITFTLPATKRAKFHFVRDRDSAQGIYPASDNAEDSAIPIKGPSARGMGRNFMIRGEPKESVTLRLSISNGHINLNGESSTGQTWSWESTDDLSTKYQVCGSFNDWGLSPMVPDGERPGVFRYRFFPQNVPEEFQIVVDGEQKWTVHPTAPDAELGEGLVSGPDDAGEGLHWIIREVSFDELEIVIDWNQLDRRRIVSWGAANSLVKLKDAAEAGSSPALEAAITASTEVVEYRVLQRGLVKRLGTEPDSTIMKLQRPVGSTIFTTGRTWKGPRGGEWVELDTITEAKGWMLVEGPGFSAPGPLLQRKEKDEDPPMLLKVERPKVIKVEQPEMSKEDELVEYREFLLPPRARVKEAKEWIALIFGLEPQKIIIAQPAEGTSAHEVNSYMKSRVLFDDDVMIMAGFKDGDEVHYLFTGDLAKAYEGKEPAWRSPQSQQSKRTEGSKFPELAADFKVLGLPETTPHDAIKHKYRKLALEYHPDKQPGDVEGATKKFQQLKDSYQKLREKLHF